MGKEDRSLKDKELVLFFTKGISLKIWNKVGNLYREIEIYNHLADYFKKIYFITYGKANGEFKYKKLLKENIEILPKKISFLPNRLCVFLIPFLYKKILKKADFLKTNQMPGAIAAVLTKFLYGNKLIVRCGYEWLRSLQLKNSSKLKLKIAYFLERIAYKYADKIIITSLENKKFIQEKFEISEEKIEVIPNYINIELFKPLTNIQKEKNRICYVGRLEDTQKNLSNLIKAIAGLSVKLVIFGNGPLREKLKVLAKDVKVNVEFGGSIPNKDLPIELNKSEIFILPSFFEGNPKALLEAMSCGLACIGTDVEGIREVIKHKENGYLCKTDPKSIKEAILEILNDRELETKISQNARKAILENFSLEKILEKEIKIYQSL